MLTETPLVTLTGVNESTWLFTVAVERTLVSFLALTSTLEITSVLPSLNPVTKVEPAESNVNEPASKEVTTSVIPPTRPVTNFSTFGW